MERSEEPADDLDTGELPVVGGSRADLPSGEGAAAGPAGSNGAAGAAASTHDDGPAGAPEPAAETGVGPAVEGGEVGDGVVVTGSADATAPVARGERAHEAGSTGSADGGARFADQRLVARADAGTELIDPAPGDDLAAGTGWAPDFEGRLGGAETVRVSGARADTVWASGAGEAWDPGPGFVPRSPVQRPRPGDPGSIPPPGAARPRRPPGGDDRPRHGWRGALFAASGGLVNPGVGEAEAVRLDLLRRLRAPLPGAHRVAVVSTKGGVGKTSVAACLGLVLAENRGDRVIALDAAPDAGTLAERLTGQTAFTVRSLLDELDHASSLTDVSRFTSLAGRLHVLASEQDPVRALPLARHEYEQACGVLTRFYNIVITDSGTGLTHPAMGGALGLADGLVVVGNPTVDGVGRVTATLDWLVAHGHAVADAVVVLPCDRVSREIDRAGVRAHFRSRVRAVVEVPADPHLASGGRIELPRLRPATVDAFLELAALVADRFTVPVRAGTTVSQGVR